MNDRKAYVFPNAAIATPHFLATAAGLRVLQSGGNAVDAAVSANLVLAVVCPHLCGVGGDLFAMVFADGELHGLNSSGRLPKAARLPSDGRIPQRGIGSVTVPGAVAGWLSLLEKFGTMKITELGQPAIRYAREGFWPSPNLSAGIQRSRDLLSQNIEAKRIFLSEGKLRNTDLANTLEDLENFYAGLCARNAPAPFTHKDFAEHRAEWVEPMHTKWNDVDVHEMPPNSRGHLALSALEHLESLDGLNDDDVEFHLRMIRAIAPASLDGDTVYLCAVDESGMAVSINESNYMGFGSGVVIPGTGVHLHNRGAYFTPETYLGGERPVHTLSPAMTIKEGKPDLVFGTMGGEAQIQIHLQLLARIYVLGMDPGQAVSRPRWVKHGDQNLMAEIGLPSIPGAVDIPLSDIAGHAHVIQVTDHGLAAASDPRSDGLAAGF